MDDRPRPLRTGQNSAYRPSRSPPAERAGELVRVGPEDSLVRAARADRSGALDVAQWHRPAAVREHARYVVTGGRRRGCLVRRYAAERAATQRLAADDGQLSGGRAKRTRRKSHALTVPTPIGP